MYCGGKVDIIDSSLVCLIVAPSRYAFSCLICIYVSQKLPEIVQGMFVRQSTSLSCATGLSQNIYPLAKAGAAA
ncbi:hypothetical protein B5181_27185 [Streptomyces sp. 4F]|nr:hypothetical protein B5181_27185 [Streptomyces sp. 4F]